MYVQLKIIICLEKKTHTHSHPLKYRPLTFKNFVLCCADLFNQFLAINRKYIRMHMYVYVLAHTFKRTHNATKV